MPDRSELGEGEILVEVYEPAPDSMNRVRFYAYWLDSKTPAEGGPPAGVRGQVYHADLAVFTGGAERDGLTVRAWSPPADLG